MKYFKLSLKDLFTFKFLLFSCFPVIISSILFFILLWYLLNLMSNVNIDEQFFNFFLGIYILKFIQILILSITSILSGALALYLSMFFAVFITSFLTPFIVNEVNLRHYNYIKKDEVSFLKITFMIVKLLFKFILFFLISMLFYLIPVVNFFAPFIMFLLLFYLYYNFLVIDVASYIINKFDFLRFDFFKLNFLAPVFIFYLIFHLPVIGPFLGFFSQVFLVTYLSHVFFNYELNKNLPVS